jgi:cell division protease FtsH
MRILTSFLVSCGLISGFWMSPFLRHSRIQGSARDQYDPENIRKFPLSKTYYEDYIRRLNTKNHSITDPLILGLRDNIYQAFDGDVNMTDGADLPIRPVRRRMGRPAPPGSIRIIIGGNDANDFGNGEIPFPDVDDDVDDEDDNDHEDDSYEAFKKRANKKSNNFEVLTKFSTRFRDVGGYESVKEELMQCVDILKNHTKYKRFNVRVPKGLILEGPPGNGKTLLAKAFAGEAGVGFIPVSGSQFQDKYVGVGSTRVRELFQLASQNAPCIIFIDEIDAIGKKRSSDGEGSSMERDSTLNELLVQMDGFQNVTGVFIVGATNRVDLLDSALTRPGRIDKKIFIGLPDKSTRKKVLDIHIRGKPYDTGSVNIENVIDMTEGFSCAQIENLMNEAMLNSLRIQREEFNMADVESVMNKMMVGWQPNEHEFNTDTLDRIAVHELGHVAMGLVCKNHAKVRKVMINLYSPTKPGYTIFEHSDSPIHTRETLFEHLMILLSGRIAEEVFFGISVTTGAINDFEEALKLAEKMVVYYGMGKQIIYPRNSEMYKKKIDDEVLNLINDAYTYGSFVVRKMKDFIRKGADKLVETRMLDYSDLNEIFEIECKECDSIMMLRPDEKKTK